MDGIRQIMFSTHEVRKGYYILRFSKKGVSILMSMKKIHFLTITLLLSVLLLPIRIATAQLKSTLEGHTDLVWSVAFSPNGKMLASADGTLLLWDMSEYTETPHEE